MVSCPLRRAADTEGTLARSVLTDGAVGLNLKGLVWNWKFSEYRCRWKLLTVAGWPTRDSRWIEKSLGPGSHSLGISVRKFRGLGAHGGDRGRMGRAGGEPPRTLRLGKPERQ